jgi:hypothetical protein
MFVNASWRSKMTTGFAVIDGEERLAVGGAQIFDESP